MTPATDSHMGRGAIRRALSLTGLGIVAGAATLGGCRGDQTAEAAEPAGGAITIWTDSTELFMEHPALVVGAPDKFAVHLTDLTDFAPLRSGKITLRFVPRDGGQPLVVTQETPRAPGIYGPAPSFTRAGVYDLTISVESPQARDNIVVPNLRVYARAADAPRETGEEAPGISFLKEQQWKTPGFRTAFALRGSVAGSIDATGEIVPAAGRLAEVAAPIGGHVLAGGVARSPDPGERVVRGQGLAVLTASLGESGSALAEARARLLEAQDEYARARRLVAAEAAPQRRLHEAEIRLQAAREAMAGLGGGSIGAGGRVVVRSPISGVVTERGIVPGSRVDAGAKLFTIIDPSVLWLRVSVPAGAAARVNPASWSSFRLEGSPDEYEARRVVSIGSVIDSLSRTLPVLYEVQNPFGRLKVGATARARVRTGERLDGVLIPTSAVLDEDGRPVAYVQAEGERFEKRELTVGGSEGGLTLVTSGIRERERVVTGAAYQVRLASLSTAVPAHGHEH